MKNKVLKIIKSRRSIRAYLPKQIKGKELRAILEAGAYAPSAHNEQAWHFTVIRNKELIDRISEKAKELMAAQKDGWVKEMGGKRSFHVLYNAPTVIVVSMRKDAIAPLVDCSAAIQNMLLAAESLGIGSCWIGLARFYFSIKKELPRLKLPKGHEPCFAVTFGYKAEHPEAKPRLKHAVTYL